MRDNFADAPTAPAGEAGSFPGGATLRDPATGRGWVLAEANAGRGLGGALAWARQFGVTTVDLLVDDADADAPDTPEVLARRATQFANPPAVWRVSGRAIAPADPAPVPPEPELPAAVHHFIEQFRHAGAEPVIEHGVLVAELLGLEVARVVPDENNPSELVLEVGVGKHDREAQKLMHPERPPFEALVAAVDAVRAVRDPDAPTHQMNQLAAERWLRAVVCRNPEVIGAESLLPVSSTVHRPDLRIKSPAPAVGFDKDGSPVVVVCSVGIDVDLVPVAADARLMHRPNARLVLVVPEHDVHPVTESLAQALVEPAEIRSVSKDWRRL